MINSVKNYRLLGMIGNFLEHFDNALFGLLAPFLAPLFFVDSDPLTALIMTYAMLPLGFFTKPIGSIVFGWIGDRYGTRNALFYSLTGMAIASFSIGSLPTYAAVGIAAPILLAFCRMLQSFCAAGEAVGGAIFVLDQTEKNQKGLFSSIYDATSIGGILFASLVVTLASQYGSIDYLWRIIFWSGSLVAVCGAFLRQKNIDVSHQKISQRKVTTELKLIFSRKTEFFKIVLASGFSYTIYSMGFTLMNGFVPLVTNHSKADVVAVNTLLLLLDMVLLPVFGFLSVKYGKKKIMTIASITSACLSVPLFTLIPGSTISLLILVRLLIIIPGIAFAAPFYAWAMESTAKENRYLIISFATSIGSQLIGGMSASTSLLMYQKTGFAFMPGVYLCLAALAAFLVVKPKRENATLSVESIKKNPAQRMV